MYLEGRSDNKLNRHFVVFCFRLSFAYKGWPNNTTKNYSFNHMFDAIQSLNSFEKIVLDRYLTEIQSTYFS